MNDIELLHEAARLAVEYVAGTDGRPATPDAAALAGLDAFDEPLPDGPTDPSDALRLLSEVADPATMVSTGPNYYGFVNGATFPVALGAAFLVNAWDQNAALPRATGNVAPLTKPK